MILPPLYKYLNVNGVKLTLGNMQFRHAKPSEFNDLEDMTGKNIFPESIEEALTKLSSSFTDVILANLDKKPTCRNPKMAMQISMIQAVFRANPKAAEMVKRETQNKPLDEVFDVNRMQAMSDEFLVKINQFMQGYRVLCVTTNKDSERMWENYSQNHQGAVLRIEPNAAKDSKFQLFKPVKYLPVRPPLYSDVIAFQEGSLFGDPESIKKEILDKIILSKTLEWEYENEYRLAIPLGEGEADYNTLPYHPEEVSELYLGLAMTNQDKEDVTAKAFKLNPGIKIFQASRDANNKLVFEPL